MDQTQTRGAASSLPIAGDLQEAALALVPDLTEVAAIASHPDIVRVSAPDGTWRVRRWPDGAPEGEVAFSHETMRLARSAGLTIVPELRAEPAGNGPASLSLAGRIYDIQRWLPGEPQRGSGVAWPGPDDRIDIPVELQSAEFAVVAAAVATLHGATTTLAARQGIPVAPPHLLAGAVRQAQARHQQALRARARHEPSVQRWLATGERLLARAEPMVGAATRDRELPSSVLHLGLWPGHVLIDNGTVSGLLGWERVAAGSPLLDLAQATLRLQGWDDQSVETALGAYTAVRDLAPEERRALPAVAALDAVATTGRLLEQTYGRDVETRPPTALRNAIEMMLRSMAALDRDLNAPERPRRRTWVRKEGQPSHRPKGGRPRERLH